MISLILLLILRKRDWMNGMGRMNEKIIIIKYKLREEKMVCNKTNKKKWKKEKKWKMSMSNLCT